MEITITIRSLFLNLQQFISETYFILNATDIFLCDEKIKQYVNLLCLCVNMIAESLTTLSMLTDTL